MGPLRRRHGPTDGTDRMLLTLIDWVEHGREPGGITMHRGEIARRWHLLLPAHPLGRAIRNRRRLTRLSRLSLSISLGVPRSKAGVPWRGVPRGNWSCRS